MAIIPLRGGVQPFCAPSSLKTHQGPGLPRPKRDHGIGDMMPKTVLAFSDPGSQRNEEDFQGIHQNRMNKRDFNHAMASMGLLGTLGLLPEAATAQNSSTRGAAMPQSAQLSQAHVVVVGAGFAGCTVAKTLRQLSKNTLRVTLVEPNSNFLMLALSNLVLGESEPFAHFTQALAPLTKAHGIDWIQDRAVGLEPQKKTLKLANASTLTYDKLVLCPGVELVLDAVEGLNEAKQTSRIVQAWGNDLELQVLKRQLLEMPNGGTFAIAIPPSPFKCPPGPYERASQVAHYLLTHKPQSRVLVLDANQDLLSNAAHFKRYWAEHYAHIIEYRPDHLVTGVDAKSLTLSFEVQDDVQVQVANVLPPMRAQAIAREAGMANVNDKWCEVNFLNFESRLQRDVHILGDAIQGAPLMPKSGHMAHAQGLVLAKAIVAELSLQLPDPNAQLSNFCYSFLNDHAALHLESLHRYDPKARTYQLIPGSNKPSPAPSVEQGQAAWRWAAQMWDDLLS